MPINEIGNNGELSNNKLDDTEKNLRTSERQAQPKTHEMPKSAQGADVSKAEAKPEVSAQKQNYPENQAISKTHEMPKATQNTDVSKAEAKPEVSAQKYNTPEKPSSSKTHEMPNVAQKNEINKSEDKTETQVKENKESSKLSPAYVNKMDNFDASDNKKEIDSDVRENLSSFEQSNWDKLSDIEKEHAVEKLRDCIADDLQLENRPNIAYYNNADPGDYGGYADSNNTIYINRYNMNDAAETADTIAHESRHCWQHERAENPQTEQDYQFKENFENYVRPEDDFRAYKNQIVESDARAYASDVTNLIPENDYDSKTENQVFYDSRVEGSNETERGPPDIDEANTKTVNDLPDNFESKIIGDDYSTKIDGKVKELEKESLPGSVTDSFKDKQFRTVETTEPITVYRIYGGDAKLQGAYATTEPCGNKENARENLALKKEWKNTMEKEATIEIPAGTKLNIGKVGEQTENGEKLSGGADQILLPQNWDLSWVKSTRDIK